VSPSSVILLQKQSKDRFGLEGDEESTMLEESVSPKKYVEQIKLIYIACILFLLFRHFVDSLIFLALYLYSTVLSHIVMH